MISTQNGFKPIEKITTNDFVLSKNTFTNEIDYKKVNNTFIQKADKIVKIFIGKDTIQSTFDHPFYLNNKWVKAFELKKGDVLTKAKDNIFAMTLPFLARSSIDIDSVAFIEKTVDVFNFEVEDFNTYFVGKEQILVHNASCGSGALVKNRPNKPDELEINTYKYFNHPNFRYDNITPHHIPSGTYMEELLKRPEYKKLNSSHKCNFLV